MSRPLPRLFRFALLFLLILCCAPVAAIADDAASTKTHEQALQTPAGKFIEELGDHAIKIIADKQISKDERDTEFSKILSDSFDLKTIGRFVIGRTWNSATPDQQSEYMRLFKALVIKNYGERMTLYTGEGFQVTGTRPVPRTERVQQ